MMDPRKFLTISLIWLFHNLSAQYLHLYEPFSGEVISGTQVQFSWKDIPGGAPYTFEIDTDINFSAPQVTQQPNTSLTLSLNPNTLYYWRVNGNGGQQSPTFQFRTADIPSWGDLRLWFQTSQGITSANGVVTEWISSGDSNRIAAQQAVFLRPELFAQGPGGFPVVKFGKTGATGGHTSLEFPAIPLSSDMTLLTLTKLNGNGPSIHYFLGGINGAMHLGGSFSGGIGLGFYTGPVWRYTATTPALNWNIGYFHKQRARRNSTDLNLLGTAPTQTWQINMFGYRPDNTNLRTHADVSEFMVFNTPLPDSLILLGENYLKFKYVRPIRLPYDTLVCGPTLSLTVPNPEDFSSILWSTGATTPTVNLTQSGTYWVRGTSFLGVVTTDTIRVSGVFPFPLTSITDTQRFLCLGDTIQNIYLNADPTQPWYWSNGFTGDTLRITEPGTYQLFQPDSSGCIFSTPPLLVLNRMNADFITQNGCQGDTLMFTDFSQDALNNPIVFFDWQFGANALADTTNADTVYTVFSQPGVYPVQLVAYNSLGCPDTMERVVVIAPKPFPQFSINRECVGNPVTFSNLTPIPSGTTLSQVRWNLGNGVTSTQIGPTTTYNQSGTYPVQLRVKFANGCQDSLEQIIEIDKLVQPLFTLSQDTFCLGVPVNTTDQSSYTNTAAGNIQWWLNGTAVGSGANYASTASPAGTNVLRMTLQSTDGCVAETSRNFFVQALPNAIINASQQLGFPPTAFQFINGSTGEVDQVRWTDPLGNPLLNADTCITSLSDTGLYQVFLHVQDRFGCADSSALPVRIVLPQMNARVLDLNCTLNSNGYVTADFSIRNESFQLPIQKMDLTLFVDQTSRISEVWEGQLGPGSSLQYTYNAQLETIKSPGVCCIQIQRILSEYNPGQFLEQPGGTFCEAMTSEFRMIKPFPNPTAGPSTVFVVLPEDGQASWTLFQTSGANIQEGQWTGQAGLHQLNLDLSELSQGMYYVEVRFKNEVATAKILVQR
jgi:hypothetical protein